ncbi:MAG: replication-associated recombination protein A [Endomicrobiia bacterium]
MDLFVKPENQDLTIPLAIKFLPTDFDNFFGQEHILSRGTVFRTLVEQDKLFSVILFGPSGTGKTSVAKIISKKTNTKVLEYNSTLIGIPELRDIIKEVRYYKNSFSRRAIVVLDEIHHFNRYQQDVLLPEVENGNMILIGITTENPYYYVNQALISRSIVLEFKKLKEEDVKKIIFRIVNDKEKGFGEKKLTIEDNALEYILKYSDGDARKAINLLEVITTYLFATKKDGYVITLETIKQCFPSVSLKYDKSSDVHYDTISAFIKSVRGSDPDAALYWMMKMLNSGEDPRFIIRRMIILASEDIGNADPMALVIATSALTAIEFVGMPESKIILSQLVTYLATAPKSNASYEAMLNVEQEIKEGEVRDVPKHLKDATRDGRNLGHGDGYLYPHNFAEGVVGQEYLPKHKKFYFPKSIGFEEKIKERLDKWSEVLNKKK